jgi:hypothetical protein
VPDWITSKQILVTNDSEESCMSGIRTNSKNYLCNLKGYKRKKYFMTKSEKSFKLPEDYRSDFSTERILLHKISLL